MTRQLLQRYADPLILTLLAGVCYLLFFYGLGDIGLLGPDEPRYASVAREMHASGDYVTPRLLGEPWFEKPALLYWMEAIGYSAFGVNEFSARFPSALAASICVFMTYAAGRRLWNRRTGLFAALILATSTGFFAFARAASMDMLLTACLTVALLAFLSGQSAAGRARRLWFYGFYCALGLGVLAKGPVALLLAFTALAVYSVIRRRYREWREWHPEGLALAILVAAPWYIACFWVNGYAFIEMFFINHNLQRFASTIHGHDRPLYFYLPTLLMLTFPWTFMMIPAFRRKFDTTDRLLLLWAVVPIVIFSFAGSKLPGYILPSIPPIAMLCGRAIERSSSRPFRVAVFIEAGTMLFIGVALGFFSQMLDVDPQVSGGLIASVTFGIAALLVAVALWLNPVILAGVNIAMVALAVFIAATFVLPRFDVSDTMRPWSRALPEVVGDDQTVFMYKPARWMEYGMQFYRRSNARGLYSPEELVGVIHGESRIFLIADESTLIELGQIEDIEMQIVQTLGNQTALWAWHSK